MKVVICDDHRMFAESLAVVFETRGWQIPSCASDPAHAVAAVSSDTVDACLMDLGFPSASGLDGITSVLAASPTTKVIVLTACSDAATLARAVNVGAAAVALKDDHIERIVEIVERTCRGESSSRRVAFPDVARGSGSRRPLAPTAVLSAGRFLTQREQETLRRLVRGESGAQLAASMGVSYSTARTHVQNVLTKLGVHSRLEAVALAVSQSLVTFDDDVAPGR